MAPAVNGQVIREKIVKFEKCVPIYRFDSEAYSRIHQDKRDKILTSHRELKFSGAVKRDFARYVTNAAKASDKPLLRI